MSVDRKVFTKFTKTLNITTRFRFLSNSDSSSFGVLYALNETIPLQESRFTIPIFEETFQHYGALVMTDDDEV